jgi:hypothetical protein
VTRGLAEPMTRTAGISAAKPPRAAGGLQHEVDLAVETTEQVSANSGLANVPVRAFERSVSVGEPRVIGPQRSRFR